MKFLVKHCEGGKSHCYVSGSNIASFYCNIDEWWVMFGATLSCRWLTSDAADKTAEQFNKRLNDLDSVELESVNQFGEESIKLFEKYEIGKP